MSNLLAFPGSVVHDDSPDLLIGDPVIAFWERLIFTAVLEACKCKHGQPTSLAILQRYWIEQRVHTSDALYPFSFDDACRNLGRDPERGRARALKRIRNAWKLKALREWTAQYEANRLRTYMVAGIIQQPSRQAIFGLVAADEYKEVAGTSKPGARQDGHTPRAKQKRRED